MDTLDIAVEHGLQSKRKAACHGGEYSSPCPFCKDGDDRFLIWPKRHNKNGSYQGGRFSCRVCGKFGDAITFLRELYGLSYVDACSRLQIEPKRRSMPSRSTKSSLPIVNDPPQTWQKKAGVFVNWCHRQLMSSPNALALFKQRGFTLETVLRFKLGYNPTAYFRDLQEWGLEPELKEDGKPRKIWLPAGLVIPTLSTDDRVLRVKIRRNDPDIKRDIDVGKNERKYVEVTGLKKCYSVYGNTSLLCAFILESELDGLLIRKRQMKPS